MRFRLALALWVMRHLVVSNTCLVDELEREYVERIDSPRTDAVKVA